VSPERSLDLLDSLPEASFDGANKQHLSLCLPNTRREVLAQIRRWADGDGEKRIYWLKGMAGTGKSTIALTVAREYSGKKRLGASFFFSRGGGDLASTRRFVATIAAQLAETSVELRRRIADAAASNRRIRGLGLYDQWERLILQPLAQVGKDSFPHPLVVVLDAMDECDNNDDVSLLVRCLAAAVAVEHVNIRVFVTSRPDQPINLGFDGISTDAHQDYILHDIEKSIVDQDLTVYYKHELTQITRTFCLDTAFLSDDTIQKLVRNSCGLFIYAATACRFVRDGGPLACERLSRLTSAERLPARAETELDRMYRTVLEYSLHGRFDRDEMASLQGRFHRVVGTIVVLFDALSPVSLAMLIAESKDKITSTLGSLHSLLDVPEQEGRLIRLLHPSFREFLLDRHRCSSAMFCIEATKAHGQLFDSCLAIMSGHLRRNMCGLRRPGTRAGDIPRSDVDKNIPSAVQYACRYWVHHLQRSDVDPGEHPRIVDFFRSKFLAWLETLALTGRLADGIAMVKLLEDILPVSVPDLYTRTRARARANSSKERVTSGSRALFGKIRTKFVRKSVNDPPSLNAVVYDAKRFLLSHSSIIEEAPLQIYCSALTFSPETSIIRRLFVQQLPKWIVRIPVLSDDWSVHLQRLSHPTAVKTVAFSSDGRLILSGSVDNTVRIWDAVTGAERRVLRGHSGSVNAVAFSPNSRLIVSGSFERSVRIWDAATGAERRVLQSQHSVNAVAFSPDSRLIVSGSSDGTVRIWDAATGAKRRVLQGPCSVNAVAFSPDSRLIVSGSFERTVRVWDAATGAKRYVLRGHSLPVNAVAFSPDGRLIVSGSWDKTVRVWDIVIGAKQRILKSHSSRVNAVAFSPDSRLIVSSSWNTVRVWDAATAAEQRVLKGHSHWVKAVAFSPNSRLIVSGSSDGTVRIWDAATGAKLRVLKGRSRSVGALAFTSDGQPIICADWDKLSVNTVAFSADSQLIVSGCSDGTVRIWDAATGAEQRVLRAHSHSVNAVAFSPDGRLIVLDSDDNTVRVWDAATAAEQRVLRGHSDSINAVAFSPDSRLIVSGSSDGTVRIWDAATGAERHIFTLDTVVRHLRFSSYGKHLVTDRGILPLPTSNCQCSTHIFATSSWITEDGEQLLYLHPDYRDLFGFLFGNRVIYTERCSHVLQLDSSKNSTLEGV
jgi:WD40 repeat protein